MEYVEEVEKRKERREEDSEDWSWREGSANRREVIVNAELENAVLYN